LAQRIQVILGSTRRGRQGEQVARWVYERASRQEGWEVELLDLADYPLPFYEEPMSPAGHKGKYELEVARRFVGKVAEGDGYILVTPEYNHSFSAVLKNALDYGYYEWNRKPAAFVSYAGGVLGGVRAVEQLRLVVVELQMAPLRDAVHLAGVRQAFDGQGALTNPSYEDRMQVMLRELDWWTRALKEGRAKSR